MNSATEAAFRQVISDSKEANAFPKGTFDEKVLAGMKLGDRAKKLVDDYLRSGEPEAKLKEYLYTLSDDKKSIPAPFIEVFAFRF